MLTPTELKQLCEQYHLRPSKKYGQNYLIQEKPIFDMLTAGDLSRDDTVVEVGPGFGVLTLPLTERVKQVHTFEIEQKLKTYWEEKQKEIGTEKVTIHWGNALTLFPPVSKRLPTGYKVLANLPYQITSNMLRTFLEVENKPERIVVMVQKEVAERMCARPGDMSLLAVSVQYYGTPKIVSTVTKGNFFPSPKVDSAIVQITNIKKQVHDIADDVFFRVVRAGFSNKRKQLAKNLAAVLPVDREKINNIVHHVCGNEAVRAEQLSIENWIAIAKQL